MLLVHHMSCNKSFQILRAVNTTVQRNFSVFSKVTKCARWKDDTEYIISRLRPTELRNVSHQKPFQGFSRTFVQSRSKHAREKLQFEVDANVTRDMPIFSYSNDKIYRMMTIFGIVQFFFWGNLAMFTYSSFKRFEGYDQGQLSENFSGQVMQILSKYNYKIAALCVLLGHVVLVFTVIYPLRTISKLVLLKGGKDVRVTTYTHFGKSRSFVVPTDHISSQQSREAVSAQVSLKIKDKWMYFLMDKRDGVFHNSHLFDHVVGLKRDWK